MRTLCSHNGSDLKRNGIVGKSSKSPWPLIRRLHEERFGRISRYPRSLVQQRWPSIFAGSKSGAAKQVCDYFGRPLVTTRGELLQPLGVLVLDTDDDRQFGVGISDMCLDVSRIDRRQVGVEIARTGIRICPRIVRHVHLLRSLRSRGEESHPVTINQVVGSIVCSMTSVRTRPPSVRPMSSRRLPAEALRGLRTRTWGLRGIWRASCVAMPRAPSLSIAASVASSSLMRSGTHEA